MTLSWNRPVYIPASGTGYQGSCAIVLPNRTLPLSAGSAAEAARSINKLFLRQQDDLLHNSGTRANVMSISVKLKQFQIPKCKGEKLAKIEFRGEFTNYRGINLIMQLNECYFCLNEINLLF